jgi:leader peptidase (prepilin peptidase)/N-methyltransferase
VEVSPTWVALAGVLGALVGPVSRAQIFRHSVPSGQPWRSRCPACDAALVAGGWRGLVAVLPPTGRCPRCRERVGPAPGAVESVTAVVLAVLAWRVGAPLPLLAMCWVAVLGVVLACVDVAVHRLPDRLTLSTFAGAVVLLGLAAAGDGDPARLGWALVNALGMAGCYLLLVLVHPAGMGLGDGKLALGLGVALGWYGWFATVVGAAAGFLLAGLVAAGLLMLARVGRKDQIPHGPFMLLGALTSVTLLS